MIGCLDLIRRFGQNQQIVQRTVVMKSDSRWRYAHVINNNVN